MIKTPINATAKSSPISDCLNRYNDARAAKYFAEQEMRDSNAAMARMLIESEMYDMLTVNWTALNKSFRK